jgi:hypothetical protein
MNIAAFKEVVAGYLNRNPSAFVKGGQDLILFAMNASKRFAQRQHNFRKLLRPGFIAITQDGTLLSDALTEEGGVPLGLKNLHRVFGARIGTVESIIDRRPGVDLVTQIGDKVYAVDTTGGFKAGQYIIIGYTWLPDYAVGQHETDFLLEDCYDWLLHSTVQHLNFMLKEDERIQLSQGFLSMLWQNVLTWDTSQDSMNVDLTLD